MLRLVFFFFFFNDTATTEIYTLSLHDALPISIDRSRHLVHRVAHPDLGLELGRLVVVLEVLAHHELVLVDDRSEEHTSELQSQSNLVCRLLLEKKKINEHRVKPHSATINQV